MVAEVESVVTGEDHQGVVADAQLVDSVEQAAKVGVHGGGGGEVALHEFAIAQAGVGETAGPGVFLLLGAGFKRAVVVGGDDFGRVIEPGFVGGGVVDRGVKRLVGFDAGFDERDGVVGDGGGDVAGDVDEFAVADHGRVQVGAAAAFVDEPVGEAVLG